ncbi:DUF6597 domain-containing transcriptional factor [Terrimonas rubra]|uniref:DUF6597 domain-containing transcriptional factor n=1 Tax=Terrimonas rubra TaxID=1035890 RepID=A0ABW6A0X8_9BACT
MNYQTFPPHTDIAFLVKCYWSLEVPAEVPAQKQRIVPDGCMEMIFILGDDIRRYTSEQEFIIQPPAIVVGQITEPFIIEPTGYVHCFAARFYPYGFANLVDIPVTDLANKETPIADLFGETVATTLEQQIITATGNEERIKILEAFFLDRFRHKPTIDSIVTNTIDALLAAKGSTSINTLLENNLAKRRQLERKFYKQVGLSPKQLGKIIRLQAALKLLLSRQNESLTHVAYESEYFDQAHFIKDFKAFTGINPKDFLDHDNMTLSSLFYTTR